MKNDEIQKLQMELSKQKALNQQLFMRVAVAEAESVEH